MTTRLRKDIAYVLLLKGVLLTLLWYFCFHHPETPRLTASKVREKVFTLTHKGKP